MKLRILYHGNCFDGVSSAAIFTKFYLDKVHADAEVEYTPTMHRAGNAFDRELFDGDENAIVDFKYSPTERLTWWFDHHQSAFLSPHDEKHYVGGIWTSKFYNPAYKSCTKFIADTVAHKYGFSAADLAELIEWADIIDGAQYEDARTAVELAPPALRLMLVIEASRDRAVMDRIIQGMQREPLAALIEDPLIAASGSRCMP